MSGISLATTFGVAIRRTKGSFFIPARHLVLPSVFVALRLWHVCYVLGLYVLPSIALDVAVCLRSSWTVLPSITLDVTVYLRSSWTVARLLCARTLFWPVISLEVVP